LGRRLGLASVVVVIDERHLGVEQKLHCSLHSTLSEIAVAMGFSDQSQYTRCFREICGLTNGPVVRPDNQH
jgi:AraC-like DNA-binding protein